MMCSMCGNVEVGDRHGYCRLCDEVVALSHRWEKAMRDDELGKANDIYKQIQYLAACAPDQFVRRLYIDEERKLFTLTYIRVAGFEPTFAPNEELKLLRKRLKQEGYEEYDRRAFNKLTTV